MLILNAQPPDITFARNPVFFSMFAGIFTNTPYSAQGIRADTALSSLSVRFTDGQTFQINYTEPSGESAVVTFTATATPVSSTDIPSASSGLGDDDYWEVFKAKVGGHPRIAPWFSVSIVAAAGLKLRVKRKDAEPNWALTVSNTPGWAVTYTAFQEDQTPPNYKVLLEVFFESNYNLGDFELCAQLEGRPDAEGKLRFDISSILAAQCRGSRKEPVIPVWDTDDPVLCDNNRRYFVRYAEQSGNPVTIATWFYAPIRYIVDGGVAQAVFGATPTLIGRDATNALLTWMPSGRSIDPDCRECITWFNWDIVPHSIVLERDFYDVDNGNVATSDYMHDITPKVVVQPFESVVIPVQPNLLGYDAVAHPDWYKMVVRVVDADSAWASGSPVYLSEARTYYIDNDYYDIRRYLAYLNGFGAPEILPCTGVYEKRLQATRNVATRPLSPGFNDKAVDAILFSRDFTALITYRTGYIPRAVAEVLQEMLIEGQIYDTSPDGYIPLRLTGTEFDVVSTDRDLHSYTLACVPRLSAGNYSKTPVSQLSSAANWQEPDGSNWLDALTQPWEL